MNFIPWLKAKLGMATNSQPPKPVSQAVPQRLLGFRIKDEQNKETKPWQ